MPITTTPLTKTPAVKVIVEGLFVLAINEETRTAQLGTYDYSQQHEFFIRACQKEYGKEQDAGKYGKSILKVSNIREGDVLISVSGRNPDIACYNHPKIDSDKLWTDPNTSSEVVRKLKEYQADFRWLIDLEGGERFHKRKLEIIHGMLTRRLILPNGILATEQVVGRWVRSTYEQAAIKGGHLKEVRPLFVAYQLACVISELAEHEEMKISYNLGKAPYTVTLPKLAPGLYHEIYVSNNCPSTDSAPSDLASDFQHYYNVLNVTPSDRFDFTMQGGVGTRINPCDLIYLGLTSEL